MKELGLQMKAFFIRLLGVAVFLAILTAGWFVGGPIGVAIAIILWRGSRKDVEFKIRLKDIEKED